MALFRRSKPGVPDPPPRRRTSTGRTPNAVVAAATRLQRPVPGANGSYAGVPLPVIRTEAWQEEAWRQYDLCSELHFAVNWLANSIGRCRLTIVEVDASGVMGPPTSNREVIALAQGLLNDPATQHCLIQGLVLNLTVAGDSYVIATPDENDVYEDWMVLSAREIQIGLDGSVTVNRGNGETYSVDTSRSLVIRVHRPHPRRWTESDSPTRSALPLLRELEELSKYLFATINSRLGGAGILALPSEMSFPSPVQEIEPGQSPFLSVLSDAFLAPIEDMSNPAALIPVVIEAPKDALGGIQWLVSPNSNLPDRIEALRERAIARLATALDMSAEPGSANHWGEWAMEERSVRSHVEPIMILICHALTEGFLAPALEAQGLDEDRYVFWFDSADLVLSPNRSVDAKDLYDRGELDGETLRKECGFSENNAPSGKEKCIRDVMSIIRAAPRSGDALLPILIELFDLEASCGVSTRAIQDTIAAQPVDGTPPTAPGGPDPNQNPKAPPQKPIDPGQAPRKDGTTPEPNSAP